MIMYELQKKNRTLDSLHNKCRPSTEIIHKLLALDNMNVN